MQFQSTLIHIFSVLVMWGRKNKYIDWLQPDRGHNFTFWLHKIEIDACERAIGRTWNANYTFKKVVVIMYSLFGELLNVYMCIWIRFECEHKLIDTPAISIKWWATANYPHAKQFPPPPPPPIGINFIYIVKYQAIIKVSIKFLCFLFIFCFDFFFSFQW